MIEAENIVEPTDAEMSVLNNRIFDSGIHCLNVGDNPHWNNLIRLAWMVDQLVLATGGALKVLKDGDLTFRVTAGRWFNADAAVNYAGATEQALTNNATNYIYLTAAGALTKNTTDFPVPSVTPHIPLATIATGTASVAAISGEYNHVDMIDYRGRGVWSICGAAGGGNALDWQESVKDRDLTAPPGSPSLGDRYIVAAGGSGAWAGLDGHIVEYNGTSWTDAGVDEGMVGYVEDEDILAGYNGSAWVDLGSFANIRDLTDGGNADALHTHDTAGIEADAVDKTKIAADVAGDGLQQLGGGELGVDTSDFAGTGLEDDGAENLRIAAAAAGDGLSGGAGSALAVNVDDSTIEIDTDTLRLKDGGTTRAKLTTESSVRYQIPLMQCRDYDGGAMRAYADNPTAADFSIVFGGWGVGTSYIRGANAQNETKTSTLCIVRCLPPEYVAGTDIELRLHARYTGAGTAGGTKTIDAEVYELTDAGAVGADLNGDGVEDLTASFADTTGFTIDGSGLVVGDRLMVVVRAVLQETGDSDPIHVEVGSMELQLGIKG